jgi:hypothetical protein
VLRDSKQPGVIDLRSIEHPVFDVKRLLKATAVE